MFRYILKIFDKKSVKNGLWLYLLQFFNTVLPMLTLPYITRVLGTSQYGVFSIALNLVMYMQVIVEYGFGMSATRKVALDNSQFNINKIFSGVLFSRIILLILCLCFTFLYSVVQFSNHNVICSLFILDICLLGYCVQVNWLFQGLQEMKYISLVNIISRSVSVILTFVFVKDTSDLFLYCLFYSFSPLLSGLIGCIVAVKKYNVSLTTVHFKDVMSELKDGWYVFTTQISSKVFGSIGITFLAFFASDHDVGVYSAIQKITNVLILCWMPVSQVLYPISSQHLSEDIKTGLLFVKRKMRIFVPLFALVAFILGLLSKNIVSIAFGPEYLDRYYWLLPLLLWVIIAIANNFYGIQILLGSGHDKEYSKCFQISVICTIVINFALISLFKGDGAAIAPALSEFVLFILLYNKQKSL